MTKEELNAKLRTPMLGLYQGHSKEKPETVEQMLKQLEESEQTVTETQNQTQESKDTKAQNKPRLGFG
jgi:hypothetical protein